MLHYLPPRIRSHWPRRIIRRARPRGEVIMGFSHEETKAIAGNSHISMPRIPARMQGAGQPARGRATQGLTQR